LLLHFPLLHGDAQLCSNCSSAVVVSDAASVCHSRRLTGSRNSTDDCGSGSPSFFQPHHHCNTFSFSGCLYISLGDLGRRGRGKSDSELDRKTEQKRNPQNNQRFLELHQGQSRRRRHGRQELGGGPQQPLLPPPFAKAKHFTTHAL
jgi:hypothetical protein